MPQTAKNFLYSFAAWCVFLGIAFGFASVTRAATVASNLGATDYQWINYYSFNDHGGDVYVAAGEYTVRVYLSSPGHIQVQFRDVGDSTFAAQGGGYYDCAGTTCDVPVSVSVAGTMRRLVVADAGSVARCGYNSAGAAFEMADAGGFAPADAAPSLVINQVTEYAYAGDLVEVAAAFDGAAGAGLVTGVDVSYEGGAATASCSFNPASSAGACSASWAFEARGMKYITAVAHTVALGDVTARYELLVNDSGSTSGAFTPYEHLGDFSSTDYFDSTDAGNWVSWNKTSTGMVINTVGQVFPGGSGQILGVELLVYGDADCTTARVYLTDDFDMERTSPSFSVLTSPQFVIGTFDNTHSISASSMAELKISCDQEGGRIYVSKDKRGPQLGWVMRNYNYQWESWPFAPAVTVITEQPVLQWPDYVWTTGWSGLRGAKATPVLHFMPHPGQTLVREISSVSFDVNGLGVGSCFFNPATTSGACTKDVPMLVYPATVTFGAHVCSGSECLDAEMDVAPVTNITPPRAILCLVVPAWSTSWIRDVFASVFTGTESCYGEMRRMTSTMTQVFPFTIIDQVRQIEQPALDYVPATFAGGSGLFRDVGISTARNMSSPPSQPAFNDIAKVVVMLVLWCIVILASIAGFIVTMRA